jgi:hypothetical protein
VVPVDALDDALGRAERRGDLAERLADCTAQVAKVWRRMCGVTSGPSPAATRAVFHARRIRSTEPPSYSTTFALALRCQRRRCVARRGEIGTGVRRFVDSPSVTPRR